jgi:hypothetical protein
MEQAYVVVSLQLSKSPGLLVCSSVVARDGKAHRTR